jgi:hypothetical protein
VAFAPPGTPQYGAPPAPVAAGGRFAGMNGSTPFQNGAHFDGPGEYECTIAGVLLKDSVQKGAMIIVELEVITTSDPARHPIGAKRSWVQKLSNRVVAFPSLVGFVAAAYQYDAGIPEHAAAIQAQISPQSEALLEGALGGSFTGKRIHVSSRFHMTKGPPPQQITILDFRPARGA